MFDPFRLAYSKTRCLRIGNGPETTLYRSLSWHTIAEKNGRKIARYRLQNVYDRSEIVVLEVHRDQSRNFHIHAYRLIEDYPFNPSFAAMLGTPVITFTPQHEEGQGKEIYERVVTPGEKIEIVKYICEPENLPAPPWMLGYTRDAHGHWYQLIEQSQGRLKSLSKSIALRCWEYESEDRTRLLIEREERKREHAESFQIYLGKELSRREIHIVPSWQLPECMRFTKQAPSPHLYASSPSENT